MPVKEKIEYYSVGEVEKYDFSNGYKTMFGNLSVPITEAVKKENEYFTVLVLNHRDKRYMVGHTSSLRSYAYLIGRYMNGQRSSGGLPSLQKVISKDAIGMASAEFIPAVNDNFEACMAILKDWTCVGREPTKQSQDNLVLMRALHRATGWARYFTVEDSTAHSISTMRWNQLKLSCKDISPKGSAHFAELSRDHDIQKRTANIRASINADITHMRGFSFDVIKSANNLMESKQLRGDVRSYNATYHRSWFTRENIVRISQKIAIGVHAFEEPVIPIEVMPPKLAPAKPVESSAELEKRLATLNQQIEEHPASLKEQVGLGPIPTNTAETEIIEFELDGEVENLYEAHRNSHARKLGFSVVMVGVISGMDIVVLTETIANVINASPKFVDLIGEVTPEMVRNAMIHHVAPNPQQDFLFFEIINIVSKYVEKKVCHE